MNENVFPSRKEILENLYKSKDDYMETIIDGVKSINIDDVDFSTTSFKPRQQIIEKQKVFTWIRVFIKTECNIKPEDMIRMEYLPSGEYIDMQFACFAKKGLTKDSDGQIVNYTSEDDTKVLCVMADMDKINNDNEDIPFIKTLFKSSNWFEFQLLKTEELKFTVLSTNEILDFYDTEF